MYKREALSIVLSLAKHDVNSSKLQNYFFAKVKNI